MRTKLLLTLLIVQLFSCKDKINCGNGIKDGDETGIDCGGSCKSCTTAPLTISDDYSTLILGDWKLTKAYYKSESTNQIQNNLVSQQVINNIYFNASSDNNGITFSSNVTPSISEYKQCSPMIITAGNCQDYTQNLSASYKVLNSKIYLYIGGSYDIVLLNKSKLIIKSNTLYNEYDRIGVPEVEENQSKLFGSWKIDSVNYEGLLTKATSLSTINFLNSVTTNSNCGKSFTISKTGLFKGKSNIPGSVEYQMVCSLLTELSLTNKWISFDNYLQLYSGFNSFKMDFSSNNQKLKLTSSSDIVYFTKQ